MSENGQPVSMGFKLFPPPPKPSRKQSIRQHAATPQSPPEPDVGRSESPGLPLDGRRSNFGGRETPQNERASPITVPSAAHYGADRSHTSFSDAPTLIRSYSSSSHQSNTPPGPYTSPPRGEEPVLRSIFPRYNPEVALEHQAYFPTQASPTHIPREAINRRPYTPSNIERTSPLQSPAVIGASAGTFPRGLLETQLMETSTNDELKQLWKVVNGWRVQQSEGRKFCMKVASAPEEPVHTLSSATHPFYTIRLDPTSSSAQMSVKRHDPNKTTRRFSTARASSSSKADAGIEIFHTTLEETARRFPPNDGLVAQLYPRAAAKRIDDLVANPNPRADVEQVIAAAEHECGRLVWDEDRQRYYLAHPAADTPFVVSVSRSPAWSRVEYALEHELLPRNMVRLVRDGAGAGTIEVDSGVAARVDCYYIMDVAICAVMLVAITEEQRNKVERFEAPPVPTPISPGVRSHKSGKMKTKTKTKAKTKTKKDRERDIKFEEFELDLESQDSSLKSKKEKVKEEKVPGFCGLLWMLAKFCVWTVSMIFKAAAKVIVGASKLLTRKK